MGDEVQLLPCPFCGGEADIDHDHTVEECHAYGCRSCDMWFNDFNANDAPAAWNTRTPPTFTPAEVLQAWFICRDRVIDAVAKGGGVEALAAALTPPGDLLARVKGGET